MDRGLALLLTALAGGLIALQPPVNATLGRSVGSLQAAFVSFVVGAVLLAVAAALARGGLGQIGNIGEVGPLYLTGGILGALYVTCALITVRDLGAGGVAAATIAGQLTGSVVIDRFGLLGVAERAITAPRIVGIVLLAAGAYLVVRR
ncbi:MAG: DMT family transporter [Solirubrobacterales bacterium]|nr:DMT family transporter [Solirubrobacterales bacterium]